MKICAITGAKGVLGNRILKLLPYKFYKFKGDITSFHQVKKWILKKDFDLLIHLAAKVPTKEVEANFKKALKINYVGTKNIANSLKLKKNKPEWVFFSSTSHVYSLTKRKIKISEKTKLNPSSKYGLTKKKAEKEIEKLRKFGIKYCIGRIFSFTDINQKTPFVIPSIINKLKNSKKKTVNLKNMNHFRDFISTSNICKIINKLYKTQSTGIFNIGSGQYINLKEIAKLFAKKYNKFVNFEDNKIITYLISNNRKILARKVNQNVFKNNINFFYK